MKTRWFFLLSIGIMSLLLGGCSIASFGIKDDNFSSERYNTKYINNNKG